MTPKDNAVAYRKLRVNIPLKSDSPLALQQAALLAECLKKYGFILKDEGTTEDASAEYESLTTVTYEVSQSDADHTGHSQRKLLSVLTEFFKRISLYEAGVRATLCLHHADWFDQRLINAHLGIPLRSVHFGCLFGSELLSHWQVSFADFEAEKADLCANFEYDRNGINVEFLNDEKGKCSTGDRKWMPYLYRLLVPHHNIRRIVVDLSSIPSEPLIHLDLHSPVIVKKAKLDGINREAAIRHLQIRRGTRPTDWSSRKVLVDSRVFTIHLKQNTTQKNGNCHLDLLYLILSRLRVRCNLPIEFAHINTISRLHSTDFSPYHRWLSPASSAHPEYRPYGPTDHLDDIFNGFLTKTFDEDDPDDPDVPDAILSARKEDREAVVYLIEALISRGAMVKDQLLLNVSDWNRFLNIVHDAYRRGRSGICVEGLSRLLGRLDENKRVGNIHGAYKWILEELHNSQEQFGLTAEQKEEGFLLIRKVVITPTRHILIVPEMCMGNRVLRQHPESVNVIRISFRDDDNTQFRISSLSKYLLEETIKDAFTKGLYIAGRAYYFLGSSNSQLRDHGAYFMLGLTDEDWDSIEEKADEDGEPVYIEDYEKESILRQRRGLGKFLDLQNLAKILARLGQCFTQSKEAAFTLSRTDYLYIPDIVGGSDANGDPYTFSDGCSVMSKCSSDELGQELKLRQGPSAVQYRYRGAKGMLSVDPWMDELADWAEREGIENPPKEVRRNKKGKKVKSSEGESDGWKKKMALRSSQFKFDAKQYDTNPIEVVKYSSPTPVCLNKPLIQLLDQVSEHQSPSSHRRISARIEALLDDQFRLLARMLISEKECRNKLKELPHRINLDRLSQRAGFEMSNEPFFRSLITASVKFAVTKQLRKEKIGIPSSLGRSMFGVLDETGRLQYGQVYVQYTRYMDSHSENAATVTRTGRIMVTKNPSNVAGDVRIFEAVDIPELSHLVDVIVFPRHGPRPHPDEMAGSDLDGDEYSVFWDEELMLERNEKAASYTSGKREKDEVTWDNLDEKLMNYYIQYVEQDSVGSISNALLFHGDLFGIYSKVCEQLALKASQAVDFPKSGVAPERLRTAWIQEDENDPQSDWLPPEKAERYPDFHFNNDFMPMYYSPRLVGRLYREIKRIEEVVDMVEETQADTEIELDELLVVDGWRDYEPEAKGKLDQYIGKITALMECYGIRTEGELFSGYICDTRNRISDKDQDDMSHYNPRHTIETRMTAIYRTFREDFFEEFGGFLSLTQSPRHLDDENVLRRDVIHCSEEMKKKASAYYIVCYNRASHSREHFLSFGWLAADVLADVKAMKVVEREDFGVYSTPIMKILEKHCQLYREDYPSRMEEFHKEIIGRSHTLTMYTTRYTDLSQLMFTMSEWVVRCGLSHRLRLSSLHISLLLLRFSLNHFPSANGNMLGFVDEIAPDTPLSLLRDDSAPLSSPMELLVSFFEFLASNHFRKLESLSFVPVGEPSVFVRSSEWVALHEAARRTYFHMVLSLRFDDLPLKDQTVSVNQKTREMPPFIFELPPDAPLDVVRSRLRDITGVEDVVLRRSPVRNNHVICLCRGTMSACERLRELVAVKPNIRTVDQGKDLSVHLSRITYENIMSS